MHAVEAVRGTNIIIHSSGFSSVPPFRWVRWAVLPMCACVVLRMCSLKTAPATHISQLLCPAWDLYNWVCRFFRCSFACRWSLAFSFFLSFGSDRLVCVRSEDVVVVVVLSRSRFREFSSICVVFFPSIFAPINVRFNVWRWARRKAEKKLDIHRTHTMAISLQPNTPKTRFIAAD